MSCKFCARWQRPDEYDWDDEAAVGECTLYPKWTETAASHFCAQMLFATDFTGRTIVDRNNASMHAASKRAREETERRRAAEKKATELRRQLKALRAAAKREDNQ